MTRFLIFELKKIIKKIFFILSYRKDFREYHHFPFNHNKPLPKHAYIVMSKCCQILENLKVNYRLTDGTVLGIYRQGDFIPHDNDIDVDVLDCQCIHLIHTQMKKLGMKLGRKVVFKKRIHQLVYYDEGGTVFDIVFWYTDKDNIIYNNSERGFVRIQEKSFFENLSQIDFKGRKYPIPSNTEVWLEMRFGADWRIPKKYKGDWKEDCGDLRRIQ